MNALTFTTEDRPIAISSPAFRIHAEPMDAPTRLKPSKGLVLGVLVSLLFWAAVAAVVIALV